MFKWLKRKKSVLPSEEKLEADIHYAELYDTWSVAKFADFVANNQIGANVAALPIEASVKTITSIAGSEALISKNAKIDMPSKAIDAVLKSCPVNVFETMKKVEVQRKEKNIDSQAVAHANAFLISLWTSAIEWKQSGTSYNLKQHKEVLDIMFRHPQDWTQEL